MNFKLGDSFIQIGKLELWYSRHFSICIMRCFSGCKIIELGWMGFTWLAGDCV